MFITISGDTILHNIEVNYRGNVKTATYREGDYKVNHIFRIFPIISISQKILIYNITQLSHSKESSVDKIHTKIVLRSQPHHGNILFEYDLTFGGPFLFLTFFLLK